MRVFYHNELPYCYRCTKYKVTCTYLQFRFYYIRCFTSAMVNSIVSSDCFCTNVCVHVSVCFSSSVHYCIKCMFMSVPVSLTVSVPVSMYLPISVSDRFCTIFYVHVSACVSDPVRVCINVFVHLSVYVNGSAKSKLVPQFIYYSYHINQSFWTMLLYILCRNTSPTGLMLLFNHIRHLRSILFCQCKCLYQCRLLYQCQIIYPSTGPIIV